jgi:hypothetical protein
MRVDRAKPSCVAVDDGFASSAPRIAAAVKKLASSSPGRPNAMTIRFPVARPAVIKLETPVFTGQCNVLLDGHAAAISAARCGGF